MNHPTVLDRLPPVSRKEDGVSYRLETLRPAVSLLFIAPILLVYELACILFDQPVRTGIDQWLLQFLDLFGFGQLILLPIVTTAVLLHLHHQRNDSWRIQPLVFLGMSVESMILGLGLFVAASVYGTLVLGGVESSIAAIPIESGSDQWWSETLGYFGAGIYEEFLFRLLLLPGLIFLIGKWVTERKQLLFAAVVLTSLLFALSHYNILNPAGVSLEFGSFLFRFLASVVFCIVYLQRGFGVAVGTHVAYDILTQL